MIGFIDPERPYGCWPGAVIINGMAKKPQPNQSASPRPHPSAYREHIPELPEHFSLLSAQTGPSHDHKKHVSLKSDLELNGLKPVQVKGNYGHEEAAFLVPHRGTERDRRTVEVLGWKHKQESVLHSSGDKHKLVFRQNQGKEHQPDWTGEGGVAGTNINSHYTQLGDGRKFQLLVRPPRDVKKSVKWSVPAELLKSAEENGVQEKLERLKAALASPNNSHEMSAPKMMEIPRADLHMISPEDSCEACENSVENCSCYANLSQPRVEFDGQTLKLFFKSDWSDEDRDNFGDDIKARAGRLLLERKASRAREVLRRYKGN
jgi:hypothetical protein